MLLNHAEKHIDKIQFPVNQGKDYIVQRGKYTKIAYGRLNQNWQNAEDAVQDAYLSILEYPPKKEMNEAEFEAFFTTVLLGVIGKMFRSERRRELNQVNEAGKYVQYLEVEESEEERDDRREEVIALGDENENPEYGLVADELLARIRLEIASLKFNHRQIVALNVLYGYKPREIVGITGDSGTNVRKIIQRFREHMEEILDEPK